MSRLLQIATQELGVQEISGVNHEPRIISYAHEVGMKWVNSDETPWCSIFVNWVCSKAGVARSDKASARSWTQIGQAIDNPKPGDIVVFWRESPHSWKGHVGFFMGFSRDLARVYCLGGNQGDSVSIDAYDSSKVIRYRRLEDAVTLRVPKPILKMGHRNEDVENLQRILNRKEYNCGDPDGIFGPKTENALRLLQADAELRVDGVYNAADRDFINDLLQE